MRGMCIFCLCMMVLSSEALVIDNFETKGGWEPMSSEGCEIQVTADRLNAKEGQTSLLLKAEFSESCNQKECFAAITREAPDLSDYAFLRLWVKKEVSQNAAFGIHLKAGEKSYFYLVPLDKVEWQLLTVSPSDFMTEGEQHTLVTFESVESISLFFAATKSVTVKVNVDEFVALTDVNSNSIPDVDETRMGEAAKNSEEMALRYFTDGDYEKAAKYFDEAGSLYGQAGNTEKAQEMGQKARESRAWLDFTQAESLYKEKQYARAMELYERARREFLALGNLDMVGQIDGKMEEISKLTGKPVPSSPEKVIERTERRERGSGAGGLLFVLIVVCLVGVGVYLWKFRGAPAPKTEEKKIVSKSEAKAEEVRKLKAKFVYGEISRKEYEKKLREMEERP